MTLTRSFKETVMARLQRDTGFRDALFRKAIELMLSGDIDTGKTLLRDYINGTVGFKALSEATRTPSKSLMRMFSEKGNPQARSLFAVISQLQALSGVRLELKPPRAKSSPRLAVSATQ